MAHVLSKLEGAKSHSAGKRGEEREKREERRCSIYLVGLHKPDKHWEKDGGGCCLGILAKVLHSIIEGILQKAQIYCVAQISR